MVSLNMIDVKEVVNKNLMSDFLSGIIRLMKNYDGQSNAPDIVDEQSGEILIWDIKVPYCKTYAIIELAQQGTLTPNNNKIKDLLYNKALSGHTILLVKNNDHYALVPYSGEIRNTVVTMGYCLRLLSKRYELK